MCCCHSNGEQETQARGEDQQPGDHGGQTIARATKKPRVKPFRFELRFGEREDDLVSRMRRLTQGQVNMIAREFDYEGAIESALFGSQHFIGKGRYALSQIARTIARRRFSLDTVFEVREDNSSQLQNLKDPAHKPGPPSPLGALSASVLVHVSQFLRIWECAALANTSRTNRAVASLNIHAEDSWPRALQTRPTLQIATNSDWSQEGETASVSWQDMKRLLFRSRGLQRAEFRMRNEALANIIALVDIVLASSGDTLQHFGLHYAYDLPDRSLISLLGSPRLTSLTLFGMGNTYPWAERSFDCARPAVCWVGPDGKSVPVEFLSLRSFEGDALTFCRVAKSAPGLRTVRCLNWKPGNLAATMVCPDGLQTGDRLQSCESLLLGSLNVADVAALCRMPHLQSLTTTFAGEPGVFVDDGRLRNDSVRRVRAGFAGQSSDCIAHWRMLLAAVFPNAQVTTAA